MKTKRLRVMRGFGRLNNTALEALAKGVLNALTENAAFPNPVVPLKQFGTVLTTYSEALVTALNGGRQEIAARNEARKEVEGMLGQLASYVEAVAPDLSTLLASGFQAATASRPVGEMTKPVIDRIDNDQSTRLAVRLRPVYSARAYEVRMSYGTNGWQAVGVFTQSRKIVLTDLTPGTVYTVQARAIGRSGTSEWSDPVSHMSL